VGLVQWRPENRDRAAAALQRFFVRGRVDSGSKTADDHHVVLDQCADQPGHALPPRKRSVSRAHYGHAHGRLQERDIAARVQMLGRMAFFEFVDATHDLHRVECDHRRGKSHSRVSGRHQCAVYIAAALSVGLLSVVGSRTSKQHDHGRFAPLGGVAHP
jgi:hypothetical protein